MMKINKKSKEGIKKKIASFSLFALLLNVAMAGVFAPSEGVPQAKACHSGSITVCKIIVDGEGNIVNGNENSGTFLIPGISSIAMPDTLFTTPLSLTDNVIGNDDAECVVHDNLPLGSYWYGEETITGDNWLVPKYNDQFTKTVKTLDDFYEYNEEGNGSNADGNIVLSKNRPDRTLVVLNQYELPPEEVTIVASKVVCDDEADLPNWGGGLSSEKVSGEPDMIGSDTAQNYVDNSNGKCRLVNGWSFQVGDTTAYKEGGSFYGPSSSDTWTTFGPTINEEASTTVDISNIAGSQLRLREVLQNGYIPFTYTSGNNSNNKSAEFYCYNDIHNYDNYDYIRGPKAGETYYCVAFNAPIKPYYGPYCGDGVVNQPWEECDNNDPQIVGCSEQCQIMGTPECSEDVFARVNITDVQNRGTNADMTENIYLGGTTSIPQGAWFPVYYNGVYMNDSVDIDTYQDVPGLVVQRQTGKVRVQIYGSHPNDGTQEHVKGNIEFYNEEALNALVNDTSPRNPMEGVWNTIIPDSNTPITAGHDYAWIDGNTSNFWMTVTVADDGYFTPYETQICEEEPTCSVFGHKYNKIGTGLVDWVIGLAQITDCAENEEWADHVVSYSPVGTIVDERDDPNQALGTTDYDETSGTYNFVSLGIGGELTLGFDNLILNGVGDDIEVVETSWGSPTCAQYEERARVEASQDGQIWTVLGDKCIDGLNHNTFDLGALKWAKYIKIVDTTPTSSTSTDGYDVDAVKALHCGNGTIKITTTNTDGEYCFTDVDAGDYKLYEEIQSGWDILKVMSGEDLLNHFVDSFFDVFTKITIKEGETTTVDFYNQENVTENQPPVADAGADQTVIVGTGVDFDGSGSTDPDGTIVSYNWDFNDGEVGAGATTTHTYTATGTYNVVLTVTDDDGATDTDTVQIIVKDRNANVIINEIMWMGSSASTSDEWIELRNITAPEINFSDTPWSIYKNDSLMLVINHGILKVGGYFLISNNSEDHTFTGGESTLNITPDFIDSSVSLPSSSVQYKLYNTETNGGDLIDIADDGSSKALAGEYVAKSVWKSMSRRSAGDGTLAENWCTAATRENWDDDTTELGTPGAENVCNLISGYKFNDLNGNGVWDDEEPGLGDWLINLYNNSDLISSIASIKTSTDLLTLGYYEFKNLIAGTYFVQEENKAGWQQTSPTDPSYYEVEISEENPISEDNNFGNHRESEEPVYQCSDGDDNDQDDLIDEEDPGCHYDGNANNPDSYEPEDNNEYNAYCGDGSCNENETCSTCSQDCGSCGGGGGGVVTKPTIIITNEKVAYLGGGEALVTWTTNIETTDQVAYGDNSISSLGSAPKYGYDSVNKESSSMIKEHSVIIGGIVDGIPYYFRPIANRNGSTGETVGKEVFYKFKKKGEVKGAEAPPAPAPIPAECNYLLEYIKLGANNNPVEVEKLERFLNEFEGESLSVNGIYEQADFDAVSRFQKKYSGDILSPWNYDKTTGYVYITTKKKINEIYCQKDFPLTAEQEKEIRDWKLEVERETESGGAEVDDSVSEDINGGNKEEIGKDKSGENTAKEEIKMEEPEEEAGEVLGAEDKEITEGLDKNEKTVKDSKRDKAEEAKSSEKDKEKNVTIIEGLSQRWWAVLIVILVIAGGVWYLKRKREKGSGE